MRYPEPESSENPWIFLKKLARWTDASCLVGKIPPEVVRKIIESMDSDDQEMAMKLIYVILGNTDRLKMAYDSHIKR